MVGVAGVDDELLFVVGCGCDGESDDERVELPHIADFVVVIWQPYLEQQQLHCSICMLWFVCESNLVVVDYCVDSSVCGCGWCACMHCFFVSNVF